MEGKFIFTQSKDTAEKLKRHGYELCYEDGKTYLFFNDKTKHLVFDSEDKICFTNTMLI